MKEYPKIQTVYLRDPETNFKTLLEGQFALPEFEYLKDCVWEWTEKIDGTNIRVLFDHSGARYAGKTEEAQIPSFLAAKLSELFPSNKLYDLFMPDGINQVMQVCLYGEGYGARIQKSGEHYISDGVSFILFDVLVNGNWLKREDVIDVADKLGIRAVPIKGVGTLEQAVGLVRSGFASSVTQEFCMAEGLVMRPIFELKNRVGQRIITKIKHKDFAR